MAEELSPREGSVSVVIPAYNEGRRLGPSLDTVCAYLEERPFDWEIVVVDDGSTDETVEVARSRRAPGRRLRVLSYAGNRGKGHALKVGMLAAKGSRVLLSDADLSTPITELESLLAAVERGADVAIGSRRAAGADIRIHQPFYRQFLGKIHSWLCQRLLVPYINDFTCGFKLFRRETLPALFGRQRQERWSYDSEILYLAHAAGYRIAEVPVEWSDDPATKVRLGLDVLRSLRGLAEILIHHRLGFAEAGASSLPAIDVTEPAGKSNAEKQ